DDGTRAVLARTNRELRPAVVAALELGWPFRAPGVALLVDDPNLDAWLARLETETDPRAPLLVRLGRLRSVAPDGPERELAEAVLARGPSYPGLAASVSALDTVA